MINTFTRNENNILYIIYSFNKLGKILLTSSIYMDKKIMILFSQ